MITSAKNPKIKRIRSLQSSNRSRTEEGVFVIEGVRLVEEALNAGWAAQSVFYTEEINDRGKAALEKLVSQGAAVEQVTPRVMRAASDTQTPQAILVVLALRELPPPPVLHFVLIPDAVRDPGNLGAVLRTAAAASVQTVFLPPNTVDPYSPKVLRAAMGAHFHIPIQIMGWDDIRGRIQKAGLQVYLADAGGAVDYTQPDFRSPLALIIGGEAHGAGHQARSLSQTVVRIPMPGGSESLNAAVAAGVILFEIVRQRSTEGSYNLEN